MTLMLGTEPWSLARTVSAFDHWANYRISLQKKSQHKKKRQDCLACWFGTRQWVLLLFILVLFMCFVCSFVCFLLFCFFGFFVCLFWNGVSFCTPGCPGTPQSLNWPLTHRDLSNSASQLQRLKVMSPHPAHHTQQNSGFLFFFLKYLVEWEEMGRGREEGEQGEQRESNPSLPSIP